MTRFAMTALVERDERSGISQSAVGVGPSGGSAKGCWSTTWPLGGLDVETCPSLRTSVQPASTAFCEMPLPEGLNIRMRFFFRIIDKVLLNFEERISIIHNHRQR